MHHPKEEPTVRTPLLPLLLAALLGACGGSGLPLPNNSDTGTPAADTSGSTTGSTDAASGPGPGFEAVPDASYGSDGGLRWVKIPVTDCVNVTATPVVNGDWLVWPMHEHSDNCSGPGPYARSLFGYHTGDGRLYRLYQGAAGEAPLTVDAERGQLWWPVTFGGTVLRLDAGDFHELGKTALGATADSSGTLRDGLFYFGTVNSPDHSCQNPVDPACGALYALDGNGAVVYRRDYDSGFRAWIGTSVTDDGTALYFGSAAQTVNVKTGDETEYLYGCSVIKTDGQLNVLAHFDPGELACHELPFSGTNLDSVSGEVVPDGNGLWVQYTRPNDTTLVSTLYRLDNDLHELCHLDFDFEPRSQAIGFYGAPTVDRDGNAFVAVTVPDAEQERAARLLRVTPDCRGTLLAERRGAWAQASPTLADDRYVLFPTDGRLEIYTVDGERTRRIELASPARVLASPVLHDGLLYVLQEDGTLNVIDDSGLTGYGDAIWPRYRHDNAGSARLSRRAPPPGGGDGSSALAGAFLVVHLEVATPGHVRAAWPQLEALVALADRYRQPLVLHFSAPWLQVVAQDGHSAEVQGWMAAGHEVGLHHHGASHKFFDGYTNAPGQVRSDGWYAVTQTVQGDMDELMALLAGLNPAARSASMSDADTDWPAGLAYYLTDSGDSPSAADLLSRPVATTRNGQPVTELYNAGYAIDHLGAAQVDLAAIESALQTGAADQYLGLVINDDTLANHFDRIEPLFQLLERYGVRLETTGALLD